MINIMVQPFYEKHTGARHEVSINFGWISQVSHGHYQVRVDGEFYSDHDSKHQAFDEVVDIIQSNKWTSLKPI